jgi:hypothetical protein
LSSLNVLESSDSAPLAPEEDVVDITNSDEFIIDPPEGGQVPDKDALFREEAPLSDPFASPKPNSSAHKLFARPPEGDGKLDGFIHAFEDDFGSDKLDNLRKLGGDNDNCDTSEFAAE